MDGVIADTEPIHMESFRIFLKKAGIPFTKHMIESMVGRSVEENILHVMSISSSGRGFTLAEGIRERNNIYLDLVRSKPLKPLPGILELIRFCSDNHLKLGLASSSDSDQVKTILYRLFGNHYNRIFYAIVTGSDVQNKKPAPDIYFKALEKLELDSQSCIAIEDSKSGIQSAKRAGISCIALHTVYTKTEDLIEADYIVKSISESRNIILEELKHA